MIMSMTFMMMMMMMMMINYVDGHYYNDVDYNDNCYDGDKDYDRVVRYDHFWFNMNVRKVIYLGWGCFG